MIITPAKKGAERKANRPAEDVFISKMENTYGTAVILFDKLRTLAKHRALSKESGPKLAEAFNRFAEKVGKEVSSYHAEAGKVEAEAEAPKLKDFMSK